MRTYNASFHNKWNTNRLTNLYINCLFWSKITSTGTVSIVTRHDLTWHGLLSNNIAPFMAAPYQPILKLDITKIKIATITSK